MLKIGILGCGRIADAHVVEILKISGCAIVGVCDNELLMAKQLQERIACGQYFDDVNDLLKLKPDIIHITTPPQSHFELGKKCLEAGSNIFVEKPFTLRLEETTDLIDIAINQDKKLTVGHNVQFSNAANRLRNMIKSGFLGGDPIHIESLWCHEHGDYLYDKNHWIRRLKGTIIHDLISHGMGIIGEHMHCDIPSVQAYGYISSSLRQKQEYDIIDELRVHIYDNDNMTAQYIFSSQIKPVMKQVRIYGTENSLIMDHEHQTVITATGNYKHYLNHFIPSLVDAKQNVGNFIHNIKSFIKREHYYEAGRLNLIQSFYNAVLENTIVPISYNEIKVTYGIIDSVFKQI